MGLEMLLHIVCPGELLVTALVGALDGLLGSVNLRMARGVSRSSESLLAAVAITVPTRVAFGRPFWGSARVAAVVIVRSSAAVFKVARSLGYTLLQRTIVIVGWPWRVVVHTRSQG